MAVGTGTVHRCQVNGIDGAGVVGHHRQITRRLQSPALNARSGAALDLVECQGIGGAEQNTIDLAGQVGGEALCRVGQDLHAAARGDDQVVEQGIGTVIHFIASPQESR